MINIISGMDKYSVCLAIGLVLWIATIGYLIYKIVEEQRENKKC